MPPKNTSTGTLYFSDGGTYEPFGLATVNPVLNEVPEIIEVPPVKTWNPSAEELEFSATIRDAVSVFRFLMTGKWPSNNWLRLHGYPMRRKRR